MGTGMGTAADEKIDSSVISIVYRLSMAEVATWSTANSKNPAFFTVNARQFWLRWTLLTFEERTSEGLIDQSNLNFIENAIAPLRPESQYPIDASKLSMAKDKLWGYLNGICSDRIKLSFG